MPSVKRRPAAIAQKRKDTLQQAMAMDALQITAPETLFQTRLAVPEIKEGEVLVQTAFVGICGTDIHLWQGHSFYYDHGYLKYPFVFGHEYTGVVVAARG